MPLLRRKPFVKNKLPDDIDEDEEVFYCELTNEVFRDYEEFCQRVILCNSLVWSCALTGKPQLTYQEALQSEENARESVKSFSKKLVIPVLYLANLTQKTSFGDLAEDVFTFARERYFIGEKVEFAVKDDDWFPGIVLRVIPPQEKEISKYLSANRDVTYKNGGIPTFPPATLYSYRIRKLDKSRNDVVITVKFGQLRRPKGVYTRDKNKLFLKHFSEQKGKVWVIKDKILQKYRIREITLGHIFCGNLPEFEVSKKVAKMAITSPKSEAKSQNAVKKEKRQETIQKYFKSPGKSDTSPEKQKSKKQSELPGKQEKKTFANKKDVPSKKGPISPKKKMGAGIQKQLTLKKSQMKYNNELLKSPQKQQLAKKLKDKYKEVGMMKKKEVTKNLLEKHKYNKKGFNDRLTVEERRQKLKEAKKEKALEEKRKRGEERAKLKEEKLRLAEFMKQWNRQREDLECEDLKELPVPMEVDCAIPNEKFGDFVMILEFLHSFSEVLPVKDFFPGGLTFELLERALTVNEVAGPLSDIIQLLLLTLFNMQEEEDDEISEDDIQTAVGVSDENGDITSITSSEVMKLATSAASWSQMYQGTALSNLTLDPVTLTEVLRLHLLSSGGRSGEMSSKWRYQQRGGYTSLDDPGLLLRIEQPHLLRSLSMMNVCDLPLGDKLQILTCLINQILTYANVRDIIDERGEKVKQLRAEVRSHQAAELKKEREAAAIRMKERKEAKQKLKEEAAAGTALAVTTSNAEGQSNAEDKEMRRQRLDRESSRRKQEIQKKSRELYHAVFGHQLLPLGCDRAHRRFWLFSSLPGLFVEHDELWAGSCLSEPTPYNPSLTRSEDTLAYVRRLFEEEGNGGGGSDKENEVGEETRPVATSSGNKKLLAEKNTSDASAVARVNARNSTHGRMSWSDSDKVEDSEKVTKQQALICTADNETCPVHGESVARTKWAFFNKEDDINALIECLNMRGIREGELRQALIQEKPQIAQNIVSCPVHKLDRTHVQDTFIPETRKSSRAHKHEDANLNYPPGTPIDEILELTLRDYILEMEEKMKLGCLGYLKVNSREAWRKAISNKSYDKQCEKLVWGLEKQQLKKEIKEEEDLEDIPMEESKDRSSTPSSSETEVPMVYRDPGRLLDDSELSTQQNPVINSLASAILQIAQCVEKKYLQKPLGGDDSSSDNLLMKRWEMSLMASTSFSQLFLHLSTLDNSIQWSRSALNAHCRLCRRRGDAENMLLCDGCNKGHHLYCLKPKLIKIPQGDWFCPKCRPPGKKSRACKNRRLFSQDSDEDDVHKEKPQEVLRTTEGKETCSTCGKSGQVLCCRKCTLLYHMECLTSPMKKPPRGKWTCAKCRVVKDGVNEATRQVSLKPRRSTASAAVAKISVFAKRLRSNSWDDTSSVQSDSDLQPTRRSGRRSLEVDLDLPLNNAVLQDLLTDIMHHKDSWPFLRPVPRAQVPDYHLIIKRPMDFGKMKYKLNMLEYRNNSEFIADALLIFENCQMYNQVDAQEYKAGVRLSKYFEKKCRELGLQLKEEELRPPVAKKPRLS